MVPREIFNYPASGGVAHLLNYFRMSVQVLECCCERVDITRLNDNSFDTVTHDIARFACGDLRQRACCGFIRHFGAAFPLRRKNMYRALIKIILWIAHKSHDPDVLAPEFFKKRFRFIVHVADQPELRIRQVQTVPCLEHVLDTFAFDQRPSNNSTTIWWPSSRLESFHVHAAGEVKQFFLRETANAKCVSRPV